MKKLVLLIFITLIPFVPLFAFNSNVKAAYAIGVFDSSGNGENVQHVRTTKNDYNDICYSKIFVVGNYYNLKPVVKIGDSIGHFQSSKPIYNNRKIKIGEVLLYKHYKVTKGYFQVFYKKKLYDTKVFVK